MHLHQQTTLAALADTTIRRYWWRMTGSNRRPPACKAGALPAELIPRGLVGLVGFEPTTPALSRRCSNRLSYRPKHLMPLGPFASHCAQSSRTLLFSYTSTTDKRERLSDSHDNTWLVTKTPAAGYSPTSKAFSGFPERR